MNGEPTERQTIAILPPAVAQRIAAGEVVDRPASVVRELVENALDAGARTIEVDVRGAGLEAITVSDDGHGIAAADLQLAFTRHATSKLRNLDDLDRINSLGFRGEALPSIAAVSLAEVVSAVGDHATGARIVIRDGAVLDQGRIARTRGTTVRVRELFGDQPVRRGFLPPARAETALIGTYLRRYALARPDVRFSLRVEGRELFRAAGLGAASALAAVYGPAAHRLRPFGPLDAGHARISGSLGDPGLTRPDRDGIVIVANGRWVLPQRWLAALEAAYRPLLRRGRHPVAVLRIDADPRFVDVNLHPAKLEIRLKEEDETLRAMGLAVRDLLGRTPPASDALTATLGRPRQRRLPERRTLAEESPPYGEESPPYGEDAPLYGRMTVLGQVHGTMILAEDAAALYLIDQHRADERAIYERLAAGAGESPAQELIEPLTVELRGDGDHALEAALPELARLGFRCERFGRRMFLVRAIPAGVPLAGGAALAAAIDEGPLTGPDWQDRLLISVACHAAVRRGTDLSHDQMRSMLRTLDRCAVQTICPHGSPIVVRLDARDLGRHFDWR